MKKWPKDCRKTVDGNELINHLKQVLYQGYDLKRKKTGRDFKYEGYDFASDQKAGEISPDKALKIAMLGSRKEDLVDAIFRSLYLLAMEQGKREFRSCTLTSLREMNLDMLLDKIPDEILRERIRRQYRKVMDGN